jgi:putative ABC transport system permease protein
MVMVINKRIKRVLLQNKAQYIGSVVLIIFSCLLFTAMTVTGVNMQRLIKEFKGRNVQEDAAFWSDKSIDNLQEIEASADVVIEENGTFDYTLSEGKTLRIFSKNAKLNIPAIIDGRELSGRGEILINPAFADAQNIKIGDRINIMDKPFIVAGFVALPNYVYPLQSETEIMYSPQSFGIAVISREDFNAFNKGSSFYSIKFNHPSKKPRAQSADFRRLLQSRGIGILQWTDISDNKRVSTATMKIEAINSMSKVVPTAILLLASILISNVIGRMIKSESAIIGTLYALGYKRKEIYRHYLVFPLVIAIIGGILGTVIGMLTINSLVSVLISAFTMPVTGINFNPIIILVSILLPVLFLGCSVYLVIRKELRHSPVELMKGDKEKNRVNFLEHVLKLEKLKFAAKFKIREQLRSL